MTAPGVDFLNPSERSDLMRRVRSTGTRPETLLIDALATVGVPFETHCENLPGKPDIVFREQRLAVFVDGEFWHGGQWRRRGLTALSEQFPDAEKRDRWIAKIAGNRHRDLLRTADLLKDGWTVIRLWDRDVEKDTASAVHLIQRGLSRRVTPSPASCLPDRSAAEFFAGIGLVRLAVESAGWRVEFANDNAEEKRLFYATNFDDADEHFDPRDIHEIAAKDLPPVSLATASFPCTDLSLAGAQRGLEEGTQSSAYLKFTSLLTDLDRRRPPFVMLENVVGLIHSRKGHDFRICIERLRDAGYTADPFTLDAKWFVPQSRPRLFIVGVRNDLDIADHYGADELDQAMTLREGKLADFIRAHPDLPWSLRPLPSPMRADLRLADILEQIPANDDRWWSQERADKLFNQMSDRHQTTVRDMMKSSRPSYGAVFRRMRNGKSMAELRTDGIAGCLRTPKGGSARQILFQAHKGKYAARLLTPRECARLMGADDIRIPESLSVNSALFAFGDAVCVPAVGWIARNYLTPLAAELIRGRILRLGSRR
ncbi:MAG TPA: DNA (cytosine-5-)-methyltransferase [Phycisphaerae bacterium]|nr:DNA (cytosine-5-)-methyltransferase [Phycisphaerae bacterium]